MIEYRSFADAELPEDTTGETLHNVSNYDQYRVLGGTKGTVSQVVELLEGSWRPIAF